MIYTYKIQKAIDFAIKTHELNQKQKRKGKDVPYITHPLTVGLILARVNASEDIIVAGILHDTIEDSRPESKVSLGKITEDFGESVAELVMSVTETDKSIPWDKRKEIALSHIKTFSNDMLLLKSADTIENTRELILDYEKDGDVTFERFNSPKKNFLENYLNVINAISAKWLENPLLPDLKNISLQIEKMIKGTF